MGTRVVQNGEPGRSDVEWSVTLRVMLWGAGLVGACAAIIVSAGVLRIFEMSSKLDVVEARQVMVLQELTTVRLAISNEDYVSRSEMSSWLRSGARQDAINAMVGDGNVGRAIQKEVDRLEAESKR